MIKLTQELAQKLGFKIRKAYVRAEVSWSSPHGVFSFSLVVTWLQFCFSRNFFFLMSIFVFFQLALKSVPGDGATKVKLLLL